MKEILTGFGGWGRDKDTYRGFIEKAPQGWQVEMFGVDELVKNGGIEGFEENFLAYLDSSNYSQVNLLGHSTGGAFALQFAFDNPEKVKRLYLIDSEGINANESLAKLAINFVKANSVHGRKKLSENLRAAIKVVKSPKVHLNLVRHAHFLNLEEEAKQLEVPTIIIWGEKDYITPQSQGKKLAELIPNSKLTILKGMDHDWIIHQPQQFWESLVLT